MKPDGMKEETYKRYQSDDFSEEEIGEIWKNTLITRARMAKERAEDKEPREITSSTYKRAQKRLNKQINDRFGIKPSYVKPSNYELKIGKGSE